MEPIARAQPLFHQTLSFLALEVLELADPMGATPIAVEEALGIGTAEITAVFGHLVNQGLLDWVGRSGDPGALPEPALFPTTHFQLTPLARSLRGDAAFSLNALSASLGTADQHSTMA